MLTNRKKSRSISIVSTASLLLGGCLKDLLGSQIIIVNQSSSTISIVRVEVSKETFEAKEIQPGQSHTWRFYPSTDSSFTVTGRLANGVTIKGNSLGYTTNQDTSEHRFIVKKDGSVVESNLNN